MSASMKLISPYLLKDKTERLLYLDCDMLCTGNKWCEEKVTEQTLTLIGKNCYELPDQDALNIVLNTKYLIAEDIFDYLTRINLDCSIIYYFGKTRLNKGRTFTFSRPLQAMV